MVNKYDILKDTMTTGYFDTDYIMDKILKISKTDIRKSKIKRIYGKPI